MAGKLRIPQHNITLSIRKMNTEEFTRKCCKRDLPVGRGAPRDCATTMLPNYNAASKEEKAAHHRDIVSKKKGSVAACLRGMRASFSNRKGPPRSFYKVN